MKTKTGVENPCPEGQTLVTSTFGNTELEIIRTNDIDDPAPEDAAFRSGTEYTVPADDNIWIQRVNGGFFDLYSVSVTVQNINRLRMVLIANNSKPEQIVVSKI